MLPTPKLTEQDVQDAVIYRDGLMLILNKPPGMPVHAGPKGGGNFEMYFNQLQYGLPRPPALAHRLDRDTSGCLIVGRHRQALARLGKLFQNGKVTKTYWAVCVGKPPKESGGCKLALKKRANLKTSWWMETCADDAEGALPSETVYKVLSQGDELCLVEFTPRTGRTHQIRVHAAAMGFPLLGDPIYGDLPDMWRKIPMHLHARSVKVPLYPNKDPIYAEAPLPPHMLQTLGEYDLKIPE